MTAYAGLILLLQFAERVLSLPRRLAQVVRTGPGERREYPRHRVLLAFVVAALAGKERLVQVEKLGEDRVVGLFVRLAKWPSRMVFSRVLGGLEEQELEGLGRLLTDLGLAEVDASRESDILDFDSTVIVAHGQQEGARFGHSGKGRRRRRHHPLVASLSRGQRPFFAVYRDGRGIRVEELIAFMAEAVRRYREKAEKARLLLRGDAGLWSRRLGEWLLSEGHDFLFAHPLTPGVKLLLRQVSFEAVDEEGDIELGVLPGEELGYDGRVELVLVRRFVHDGKAPPPGKRVAHDPDWRYQALVTNRTDWSPLDLWRCYNGRADVERVFKEGKQNLGLGALVGHRFTANRAAFLLRLIALNLDRLFHAHALRRAQERKRRKKRRKKRREATELAGIGIARRQERFYQHSARLLRVHGRYTLRPALSAFFQASWTFYSFPLRC